MALNVGTLTATLNVDDGAFNRGLGSAESSIGKFASKVGSAAKLAGGAIAAGLTGAAALALGDLLKESVASVQRIERINTQTASAIKATGGAAGVTADHIIELTGALEGMTATEAESIQQGANMLLTFTNVKNGVGAGNDVFDQATRTITDMSRALDKTGGANVDTAGTALQLGKALNDPIKGVAALGRVGVSFNDTQKDTIKRLVETGDTMGAQKIILAELSKEFGGAGEAFASTTAGRVELAKHALGTFGEAIVQVTLPPLAKLGTAAAGALNGVAEQWPAISAAVGGYLEPIATAGREVFGRVVDAAQGLFTLFRDGDFTGQLASALNVEEDSPVVDVFFRIRDTYLGLVALFRDGDFTGALRDGLGIEEDSAAVDVLFRIRDAALAIPDVLAGVADRARTLFGQVGDALVTAGPPVLAFVGWLAAKLYPIVVDVASFVVGTLVPGIASFAATIVGTVVPAIAAIVGWLAQHTTAAKAIAAVIGVVLLPVLVSLGVAALVSAGKQVAAWVMGNVAAVKGSASQVISHYRVVAGWVAQGVAALRSGAQTAAIWALYKVEAVKGAAASVASAARVVGGWVLMGVQSLVQAARMAAAWFIALGPIGWAIAAVVGLVALVIANWDTVKSATVAVWTAISGAVGAAWDWVTAKVSAAVSWVVGFVRDHFLLILAVVGGPLGLLVGLVIKHWDAIVGAITSAWNGVVDVVRGVWDNFLFPIFDLIATVVRQVVGGAWDWLVEKTTGVWASIKGAVDAAWSWVRDTVLIPLGRFVVDVVVGYFTTLWNGVQQVWEWIKGGVSAAWAWIRDTVLIPLGTYLTTGAILVWQTLRDGAVAAWNGVKDPVMKAWEWVRDQVFAPLGRFVTVTVPGYFTSGVEAVRSAWTAVSGVLSGVWDTVKSTVWAPIETFLTSTVPGYFTSAVALIGTAWDAVKETAKKPIRWVVDTVINKGVVGTFNAIAAKFPGVKPMETVALPEGFANGSEDHRAQIARAGAMRLWAEPETGGEAYIPLAASKRSRSTDILANVAQRFGYGLAKFADGGLVDLGKQLQGKGFRVSEHPAFGGVNPVHANGSQHYKNNALDVNLAGTSGTSAKEQAAIDAIIPWLKGQGFGLLWRVKDHFNHLHINGRNGVVGKVGDLISGAVDAASDLFSPLSSITSGLAGKAAEFGPLGEVAAGMGRKVIDSATSVLSAAASKVSGLFTGGGGADVGEYDGAQGKLTPAQARAAAKSMLPSGWDWGALDKLWQGESGWSWSADNPTSSAYGIPQALPGKKMASAGSDWATNAITQIKWGLSYIRGRKDYGTSQAAYAKWMSRDPHWYDTGGWLPEGLSMVMNGTGGPEPVLTVPQLSALKANADAVGRLLTAGALGRGDQTVQVDVHARVESVTDAAAVGRMIGFELGKVG